MLCRPDRNPNLHKKINPDSYSVVFHKKNYFPKNILILRRVCFFVANCNVLYNKHCVKWPLGFTMNNRANSAVIILLVLILWF